MEINEVTGTIIGCAMRVHSAVGPGLLESVYRRCMHYEMVEAGLKVQAEYPIPVSYRGVKIDVGFRVDFLVEEVVLLELKALAIVPPIYETQLLTCLRMDNKPMGLLINFHVVHLRDGIRRIANQFPSQHQPK